MNDIIDNLVKEIKIEHKPEYINHWKIQSYQYAIEIESSGITHISSFLVEKKRARILTINASRIQFNKIELMYIFSLESIHKNLLIVLRSWISAVNSEIQSITPIIPAANFFEREISEMVGVQFIGHPTPYRLILPYEWPKTT
ncbi:MAG: NADH-quinone oxidoreductase subunit C [Candidatus Hodarchaeota archaeon]